MTRIQKISLVGVLIFLSMAFTAYVFYKKDVAPPQQVELPPSTTEAATGEFVASQEPLAHPRTPPQSNLEYHNNTYHFSLFYPQGLVKVEYAESNGGHTITFEKQSGGYGFQIYIVKYRDTTISKERFRLDVPSGVMQNPTDVFIDGVRGTMFLSTNSVMGDTREVWFIRGGYLYEVTTYRELDNWLAQIMKTWVFVY